MAIDTIKNLNEIFLRHFPGKGAGVGKIITSEQSRFQNQPGVLSPEFDIRKAKWIDLYPERMGEGTLSDKLDKLLWDNYDIFKHISEPILKMNEDYTVIFPLLDLFDMSWNERNQTLAIRGLTSKTELNGECVSWLASGVMNTIDKQFEYWELDMGNWWTDTIATRKRLKELSNPLDGTDYEHQPGYYSHHLIEKIDWEEGTIFTDKAIFVYRILCEIGLADKQDLLLLDSEPTNGILRKTLSEFVRAKIKSYQNWIKRLSKS